MSREFAPTSPAELSRMLGRDDDDSDVAVLDAPAPARHVDPLAVLQRLQDHFGADATVPTGDWPLLLGSNANAALLTARTDGKLGESYQQHHVGSKHETVVGFKVGEAVAVLRKLPIAIVETPVLRTLLTMSLDEALPVARDADYSGATRDKQDYITSILTLSKKFGIDADVIKAALSAGKIRNGNFWAHSGLMSFAGLREWIAADGVKPKWSAALAAAVLRQRNADKVAAGEQADAEERAATQAAADSLNPIHQAFDRLESSKADEENHEREELRRCLARYREILLRTKTPEAGDAKELATLCDYLHCEHADSRGRNGESIAAEICRRPGCAHEAFGRQRVLADEAIVAEVERLELLSNTADTCRAEVEAASQAKKEIEKRHAVEAEEARRRLSHAWRANADANSAPQQLRELRRNHPVLFST